MKRRMLIACAIVFGFAAIIPAQEVHVGNCTALPPARDTQIVHGPYPSIEELQGEWIGGITGESRREFLRVKIDCEAAMEGRLLDGYGMEFRTNVKIIGDAVEFRGALPSGDEFQFSGFLKYGVLRGTVSSTRGEDFFYLERIAREMDFTHAFEGIYETGVNEWLWMTRRPYDRQLVVFDGSTVAPVFATENQTVLSLAGNGAILILDDRRNPAQAWMGEWNEIERVAVKRGMYHTEQVQFGDGSSTWTATLHLPARIRTNPALLMMGSSDWPPFDERLHAHEFARIEVAVMQLPRDEPELESMARAAIEYLTGHSEVIREQIALFAQRDAAPLALELLDHHAEIRGAIIISPPPAMAEDLKARIIAANHEPERQHLLVTVGTNDPLHDPQTIPSLPDGYLVYSDVPHSNMIIFSGANEWMRITRAEDAVVRYPVNYFQQLRNWMGATIVRSP